MQGPIQGLNDCIKLKADAKKIENVDKVKMTYYCDITSSDAGK